MQLVIINQTVFAIHPDEQAIQDAYPQAVIKKIHNGFSVHVGDADPTLTHPEYLITMQLFLHTADRIRIVNEGQSPSEFTCSPSDFVLLEPDYTALTSGAVGRYWTPEQNYAIDVNGGRFSEDFDGSIYTAKCDQYGAALPCIYAHVSMSKTTLCLNADPQDSMTFTAALKATTTPTDPSLPITAGWIIRLRNKDGEVSDAFSFTLTNGESGNMTYTPPAGILPQVLYVEEADFASIELSGQRYQVKLVNPVEFTLYRILS